MKDQNKDQGPGGRSQEEVRPSTVDSQFLADLSGIKTLGRYEILKKLGQGSMGVVYLGRDPYIKREVGIKVTRPGAHVKGEEADKYREKFFTEAQSAGRLMHPSIVAIYDAGMYKDFCYMTMEYVDGPTLKPYCTKGHLLPVSKAAEIVFTTCKALDYAHRKGVIHRDIKPANIMLNKSGRVKIADFGIARVKSEQTGAEGIIGSPSYMSPEQAREKPADNRSDIFSLGCVFYELLTGQKAFTGENDFAIMYKIAEEDPVPMQEIRSEIPDILMNIVGRALSKDPQGRYQSCGDFAYDLRVALRGFRERSKTSRVDNVLDYVHNVRFFKEFTQEQVKEVLEASNIIKVPEGKVIITEGDVDDSFFIILNGSAGVYSNSERIALIGKGECFGEMAYLSGEARVATVRAETECILMQISPTLLVKASEEMQLRFLKSFGVTLIERLSKRVP